MVVLQDFPDQMVLVRKRSPLCIGIGDNEMFVASDPMAFAGKTKKVIFVPDESFAIVKKDMIELYDFTGKALPLPVQELELDWDDQEKKGHEHHMLKEIYDQKNAIYGTVAFLRSISNRIWDHIGLSQEQVKKLDKITLVGCGTSWHAAALQNFSLNRSAILPARVSLASEFRYNHFSRKKIVHIFLFRNRAKRLIR